MTDDDWPAASLGAASALWQVGGRAPPQAPSLVARSDGCASAFSWPSSPSRWSSSRSGRTSTAAAPPPRRPRPGSRPEATIGGPFTLVDQNGRVTDQNFRGRLMLVYFGYTHCPDDCPLELNTIGEALDQLPAEDLDQVLPVFITVDPARDTLGVMKDYVGATSPRACRPDRQPGRDRSATANTGSTPASPTRRRPTTITPRPLHLHLPDGPRRPLPDPFRPRHDAGRHGQAPRLSSSTTTLRRALTPRPCELARPAGLHLRDRHTLAEGSRARSSIG